MPLPYPLDRVVAHGGVVRDRPGEINLVGVRTAHNTPDMTDDLLYILWRDVPVGPWNAKVYPLETEPSVQYLTHPLNPAGTAIMYPGQYRNAYRIGLHRGRPALVQVAPVKVYRDANRNGSVDLVPGSDQSGMFAINIHDIQGDLAGCQGVPAGLFPEVLAIARKHEERYGAIDYALLDGA